MQNRSNLQLLRRQYHITLAELGAASGFSNQYISRAELGKIHATAQLEEKMDAAMETLIAGKKEKQLLLEADFLKYRGRLLEPAEDESHE